MTQTKNSGTDDQWIIFTLMLLLLPIAFMIHIILGIVMLLPLAFMAYHMATQGMKELEMVNFFISVGYSREYIKKIIKEHGLDMAKNVIIYKNRNKHADAWNKIKPPHDKLEHIEFIIEDFIDDYWEYPIELLYIDKNEYEVTPSGMRPKYSIHIIIPKEVDPMYFEKKFFHLSMGKINDIGLTVKTKRKYDSRNIFEYDSRNIMLLYVNYVQDTNKVIIDMV